MYCPGRDPLLLQALGDEAGNVVRQAAEKHVAIICGEAAERIKALGKIDDVVSAMEQAIGYWLGSVLNFIAGQGMADTYGTQDVRFWGNSARCWIEDEELARELFAMVLRPENRQVPNEDALERSKNRANPPQPPYDYPWSIFVDSFRRDVERDAFLAPDLRDQLLEIL